MLAWYQDFVSEQIHDLPKGDRGRGLTVLGLWAMVLIPFFLIVAAAWYFFMLYGLAWIAGILLAVEVIVRLVDKLSK